MNINFTGIHSPRVFIRRNPLVPNVIDSIALKCHVTDDEDGKDLSELKRVTKASKELAPYFEDFNEYDILDIKTYNTENGTNISLNNHEVDYSDYSIFGILTVIATITRKSIPNLSKHTNCANYVKAVNSFIDKVGKVCLERVFK